MSAINIDIIFLSYSKNEHLKELTEQSIATLLKSENPEKIHFNVLVIESNKTMAPYQFENSKTIYPKEKFGFHKYLNIGINATASDYVCLCNNDLIFHEHWASEIIKAMEIDPEIKSAVPFCTNFHRKNNFPESGAPIEGYFGVLTGWCIFVKREIFNTIGLLDEHFVFWYCDYDYSNTLEKFYVKNCLIPTSKITHLGSESVSVLDEKQQERLTQIPRFYFNYKWHHHSYPRYVASLMFYKVKKLFFR
ncbi:glycosyltransferase [Pedobacter sp. HDW13]|uniref:glycosyltransferase family 2 protein n=1 Tax=Pedobacter sp. HDW13 TaxID=2714940 RepID=UPI00140D4880|nr:glycosyltransferase [Pedobacter sp. HDW13]QIL40670.1 glycosyltransferase [Pedobacter sp. HDW13]